MGARGEALLRQGEMSTPASLHRPIRSRVCPDAFVLFCFSTRRHKQEEEETCGFCKFMKGGACKEVFIVSRSSFPAKVTKHTFSNSEEESEWGAVRCSIFGSQVASLVL